MFGLFEDDVAPRQEADRAAFTGVLVVVGALLLAAAPGPAQARDVAGHGDPPRVHVIATGGTIAYTPDGSLTGEALVAALPGLERVARVSVEEFLNVGSSQITPDHWLRLSLRIQDIYRQQPDLAGVVVTHGTDTLEETALFLHLTVADARPVVVTGAMRPAQAAGADGPANLMNAVRLAADTTARDRPVLVLMNDRIHAAPGVQKAHTTRVDAFVSVWPGVLGVTDPDLVSWQLPAAPGPLRGAFPVMQETRLPRVDIVYAYAGADGSAVRAAADAGARGVVVATVGRGNMPAAQREAVNAFATGGGAAVLASRTQAGRVPVDPSGGIMGAGDLSPQQARVLLILALTTTTDLGEAARLFQAIRGPES